MESIQKEFIQNIWDNLAHGKVWKGRIINKKKDDSLFEVRTTISPVKNISGKTLNYVGLYRDVTEEIKLQKQMQQVQKMEAIGTLAGGIAHDFNNVLGAIIGFTEMALYDLAEGGPVESNLQQVLEASYRAKDLVKQILTFSRQEEREKRPLKLSILLKEVIKFLRASVSKTIEIRQSILSKDMIFADPTQIYQVLMNLCTNAAYAMRENGGILDIKLSNVKLTSTDHIENFQILPGDYVKITVKDTGPGIDPKIIHQIFNPFFTTKKQGEGTGLGLAVVHGIVKDVKGAVHVENIPEEGARFDVYFPRIEGKQLPNMENLKPYLVAKKEFSS